MRRVCLLAFAGLLGLHAVAAAAPQKKRAASPKSAEAGATPSAVSAATTSTAAPDDDELEPLPTIVKTQKFMNPIKPARKPTVTVGAEVLFEDPKYRSILQGKRVGLVTNPTGVDSCFEPTIDKLFRESGTSLTALFAPEHGLRGAQTAGESVSTGFDSATSLTVYSLHGTDDRGKPQHKPTTASLAKVDVLIYDIQDIGNRSYTFVGTMAQCMVAAKEHGKKFVVLDRPNPTGDLVDGNVLNPKLMSLVGWAPVPYLYGMTPGEMARWMNDNLETTVSGKAKQHINCDLEIVPMKGYKRSMRWADTGIVWLPPSTHIQHPEVCYQIAVSGFLGELRSVSEGVGYPAPFEYVGAPFIDGIALANNLNARNLPGIFFRPTQYRPFYGTYVNEMCGGVQIVITDADKVRPVEAGLHLMEALHNLYPDEDILRTKSRRRLDISRIRMFDKVIGDTKLRKRIVAGEKAADIAKEWEAQRAKWLEASEKYHLYK